jgi:hypothetical protein
MNIKTHFVIDKPHLQLPYLCGSPKLFYSNQRSHGLKDFRSIQLGHHKQKIVQDIHYESFIISEVSPSISQKLF